MRHTVPMVYAIYSLIVFFAGVTAKIDPLIWGFLSFFGYFPFSIVTEHAYRWFDLSIFENGSNSSVMGLYTPHVLTFSFDVIGGTIWWFALAWCFSAIRNRRNPAQEH